MIEQILEILMIISNTAVLILNKQKGKEKPKIKKPRPNKIIKDETWKRKLPSLEQH